MTTLALISTTAHSLANFRGPLIHLLDKKGIRVLAIAPNFDETTRSTVISLGGIPVDCPMSRSGMNPIIDIRNTYRLARLLRQIQPDITLGYFVKPVIYGTLAAWAANVPRRFAMIEGLGYVFTPTKGRSSLKRRILRYVLMILYRFALTHAERVFFLNPDDMAEFVTKRLVTPNKIINIGGIGVDLNKWLPAPPVIQPVTFLFVGRLLKEKGVEEYVNAARIVKKRVPQTRFLLLGKTDTNPGSISDLQVRSWVDEGILEWYGFVPVKKWIAQTSVFVLPSYREGFPVSTQEAMAMARPVITTDVPGCRETVVNRLNGFLVPIWDTRALAQKMLLFVSQPDLIATMGRASRKLAEERFDVQKASKRIMTAMNIT